VAQFRDENKDDSIVKTATKFTRINTSVVIKFLFNLTFILYNIASRMSSDFRRLIPTVSERHTTVFHSARVHCDVQPRKCQVRNQRAIA